jgi:hypothetical protein
MATKRRMIELYVEQVVDPSVTTIQPIVVEAFIFLDPSKRTVVAEITSESVGGIFGTSNAGTSFAVSDSALARLRLIFHDARRRELFWAPSHVLSPEFADAIGAGLLVTQIGMTASALSASRAIAAHAYIDQID